MASFDSFKSKAVHGSGAAAFAYYRLGALAERYFKEDPATCLIKLRQYGETLAQLVAAKAGLFRDTQEPQADLLRRLKFDRVITAQVGEFFHYLRSH